MVGREFESMKNKLWPYLVGLGVIFVGLAVGLFFVTPYAPLFVLASLVIQAPIIYFIARTTLATSYYDRAAKRRTQYEEDGDAEVWLAAEEKEVSGGAYKGFSRYGKSLNALNRAQALHALGRKDEAKNCLAQVNEKVLNHVTLPVYEELSDKLSAKND